MNKLKTKKIWTVLIKEEKIHKINLKITDQLHLGIPMNKQSQNLTFPYPYGCPVGKN